MDLHTSVAGITLANPLMPASGPLTGDAEKMCDIASQGVGAVVSKTVSVTAARVPRPCIRAGRDALQNAELWSEHGPEVWAQDFLPAFRAAYPALPLFVSVGYHPDEVASLIPRLAPFADAFEVSTHYVGKDLDAIAQTVRTLRDCTDKPFFFKLSPHIPDAVGFAQMVVENGGAGVAAANSVGPAVQVDLAARSLAMGNGEGEVWLSGPAIKPLALALVRRIRRAVPACAVLGVGGVQSVEDVLEFLLAGADAVQMLSGAMLKGRDLYARILKELPAALARYGFASVEDVRRTGLADFAPRYEKRVPRVDDAKCVGCASCANKCPYFAINMQGGKARVDGEKCFGCGLCQSICPARAIAGTFEKEGV